LIHKLYHRENINFTGHKYKAELFHVYLKTSLLGIEVGQAIKKGIGRADAEQRLALSIHVSHLGPQ